MREECWKCRFFDEDKQFCQFIQHTLENGYAMEYHSKRCRVEMLYDKPAAKKYNDNLKKLVKKRIKGSNILVLGCHPDLEIPACQKKGRIFTIIEPNPRFSRYYARILKNITLIDSNWEDFHIAGKFDTILCLDCIEHSERPFTILDKITEMSDHILLSCPNGIYNFQDAHRYFSHGHGAHVYSFTRDQLYDYFIKRGFKTNITGVKYPWLGSFAFGIFLEATRC